MQPDNEGNPAAPAASRLQQPKSLVFVYITTADKNIIVIIVIIIVVTPITHHQHAPPFLMLLRVPPGC